MSLSGGNETVRVMFAPSRFLQGKISVSKGDLLEITGSRLSNDAGEKLIIARTVKKGTVTVELRDDKGTPRWPMRKK